MFTALLLCALFFLEIFKIEDFTKNQQAKNTGEAKRVIKIQNVSLRGHEKLLKDVKLAQTMIWGIYFNLITVVVAMDQNTFR